MSNDVIQRMDAAYVDAINKHRAAFDDAPQFDERGAQQAMRAAARVLLEGLRQHDPCDIVIDGAGPVCARHDRSPGQCQIEQYARLIGVGLTTIKG